MGWMPPADIDVPRWRVLSWAYQLSVVLDFSRLGKPTDNAFIEAFNDRFRAECLNPQVPDC